jgi:hypothetical protein
MDMVISLQVAAAYHILESCDNKEGKNRQAMSELP